MRIEKVVYNENNKNYVGFALYPTEECDKPLVVDSNFSIHDAEIKEIIELDLSNTKDINFISFVKRVNSLR